MVKQMKFSIIVVCLNAGTKLNQTLDSIFMQTYPDYEIIVKDGGSSDGSIEQLRKDKRLCLYREKDSGIYDAMNQAVAHARGEFILFLNCGDVFYDETVLEQAAGCAAQYDANQRLVLYGDTCSGKTGSIITSAPQITGFTCYRNIPCHQSCIYAAALCRQKPYDLQYRIRADYDHFLWCYYTAQAQMVHIGCVVASYEGGGFSENKKNYRRDKEEHRQITEKYMTKFSLAGYRLVMLLTLTPLRKFLAENRLFSGMYHKVKQCCYRGIRG